MFLCCSLNVQAFCDSFFCFMLMSEWWSVIKISLLKLSVCNHKLFNWEFRSWLGFVNYLSRVSNKNAACQCLKIANIWNVASQCFNCAVKTLFCFVLANFVSVEYKHVKTQELIDLNSLIQMMIYYSYLLNMKVQFFSRIVIWERAWYLVHLEKWFERMNCFTKFVEFFG